MKKVNEIKKTVADNLKKYRREKGMTQKELADEVNKNLGTNFKHNTISSWENGTNSIDTTVSRLLGHSSIKTTEIYAHVLESTKIKDVENLNALFK